jgi:hypothetical protein
MLSLMPEELLARTCQLVCYGLAALSAVVMYVTTPKW